MKLQILGAGGHGRVCADIARETFSEVAFLDDNAPDALGNLAEYEELTGECDAAFVAVGNPVFREEWTMKLMSAGYKIATLISSKALICGNAKIGAGCVVMPGAVLQVNTTIGDGGIISTGAIVDHDAILGAYCHVNAGAIVPSMSEVPAKTKVNYGEVWKSNPNAVPEAEKAYSIVE